MNLEDFRLKEMGAILVVVAGGLWAGGIKMGDLTAAVDSLEGTVSSNRQAIHELKKQRHRDQKDVLDAIEATRLESKADRQLIIKSLDRIDDRVRKIETKADG